ncbi:MAG: cytochrome b6-f complex iron-sulfur subunit [Actinomycetota bacterium]|nr:cytochrome b6-f complex iron-sulfur subunit [Actinomycetota bacterium]
MAVAIVIILILIVGAGTLLVTARRNATTGALNRETRKRDAGLPDVSSGAETSTSTDLELQGRERADETRAQSGTVAERQPAGVTVYEPVDEDELGVTRRQFLNRGVLAAVGFGVATFGAGVLAFLWPTKSVGFGGKVPAGKLSDILGQIADTKTPFYVPLARTYIQPYPKADVANAKKIYPPSVVTGMEQGVVALYQKCVHLGCRVPWCSTAQWFECPCHGSKYNRVGEKRDGPAPRGLDRFLVTVDGGKVTIDTGSLFIGPPIGTDTTGQKAEGPHCI